jgi:hypothetical protein
MRSLVKFLLIKKKLEEESIMKWFSHGRRLVDVNVVDFYRAYNEDSKFVGQCRDEEAGADDIQRA